MTTVYRNGVLDTAACFELFTATGWNRVYELTEDEYLAAVRGSWHVVAALDGEHLVGLGRIISDGQLYAMIVDVIVRPEYRGQGIGTAIMEQLLEHCKSTGICDVKLFAAKGKTDFYHRFGFLERSADAPGMGLRIGRQAIDPE